MHMGITGVDLTCGMGGCRRSYAPAVRCKHMHPPEAAFSTDKLMHFGYRVSLKPVMHNEVVSQVQTMTTLLEGVLASKGLLDSHQVL